MTLIDEKIAFDLAELFGAFSDASRLRIISVLIQGEKNVNSVATLVGLSESATSHHLRGLRQLRLVKNRKQGREVYYSLADDHIEKLFEIGLEHVKHR